MQKSKKDLQFPSIETDAGNSNTYLKNPSASSTVRTTDLGRGNINGDLNIQGRILVTDNTGVVRLVLGYDANGF